MKKCFSIMLCLVLMLSALSAAGAEEDSLFSSRDLLQEPDLTEAEVLELTGQSVTIDHGGVFLLSGELAEGQILVEAGEEDKVQLVLDGVVIHRQTGAAIEVISADKVFITLAQGSENRLSAEAVSEDGADGVIYSKSDLTLNGTGSLTITAGAGSGIVCKDTLAITGGSYEIQAAKHGISGKDGLNIADGSFTITTGGGSEAVQMEPSDDFGMGRNAAAASQTEEETLKAKGLKSDGPITVLAGTFTLDCADDAVHAGADVTISSGTWAIRSADDAIHSDETVTIGDGSFDIPCCYEGIEGKLVTFDGGSFQITSTDDGINATGEDSATGFRMPGMDTGAVITVNGGSFTIVSDGDCLDSNGTILLNGGTLNLTCNGRGNTALDSESGITNNGAQVTTNDGSENGTGFGRGQMGGKGGFGGNGQFPEGSRGQFPQGDGGWRRPEGAPQGGQFGTGFAPDGTSQATPSQTGSNQTEG